MTREQDVAEFGKSLARLIWCFTDEVERHRYREERRQWVKEQCVIMGLEPCTYKEYLDRDWETPDQSGQ